MVTASFPLDAKISFSPLQGDGILSGEHIKAVGASCLRTSPYHFPAFQSGQESAMSVHTGGESVHLQVDIRKESFELLGSSADTTFSPVSQSSSPKAADAVNQRPSKRPRETFGSGSNTVPPKPAGSKAAQAPASGITVMTSYDKVYSAGITLSSDYLLDGKVPWSKNQSEHVLCTNKADLKQGLQMSQAEKLEVLRQVGEIFWKSSKGKNAGQPVVHFEGQHVFIRWLDQELLETIYDSPPKLDGVPLTFVSKGYPHPCVSMYRLDGLSTMTQGVLRNRISSDKRKIALDIVFSATYKVRPLEGDPICSGSLVIFATSQEEKLDFLGHQCHKISHNLLPAVLPEHSHSA